MSVPNWLTATWGELFSGEVVDPETGEIQTGEQKRRVFEASIAKATCEGLTIEELNALVRQLKSVPFAADLWWLHEFSAAEYEGLRQLGGCPAEQFTPAEITTQQVAIALEAERKTQRRWMIGVGAGALAIVGLAAWALWPRKRSGLRRRRR